MKKLNITKEQFEKSRYFKNKYGKLEYVSESGKVFKTNKDKVLMFKEAIMGGGEYEPSYDDDEEPLAEWKVGDRVNIDVWQVQWEYDDDDLADLPKTGWKIINVERDENYDDCDGYCYTIVNIKNPKLKMEVSSSALVERTSVKKSGRKLKESTKKFSKMSIDRDSWLDENLYDLILKLDDVAIKAKTELKDKDLFIKLRGIVNDLTDIRLEGLSKN